MKTNANMRMFPFMLVATTGRASGKKEAVAASMTYQIAKPLTGILNLPSKKRA